MNQTKHDWTWLIRYAVVIIIALLLSSAFASMDLFSQTWVVKSKLTAAKLVQFIGYATALTTFWIAGKQLAVVLQTLQGRWAFAQHLLLPLVTLIVVSAAHSVGLLILQPLLEGDLKTIYSWLFILAILACAAWLIMAALGQSTALNAALTDNAATDENTLACKSCGAKNDRNARFCQHCAQALN